MADERKPKFSLFKAAALGATIAIIITIVGREGQGNAGYWFGVAGGGALLFVGTAALLNIWRR